MKKKDFTLFWAVPPTQADFENLVASRCQRVMVTYQLAKTHPDVLERLASINRRVIVRIEEENREVPGAIAQTLSMAKGLVPIDAVITGCEPETGCDMRIGAPSWCQDKAFASASRVSTLIQVVRGLNLVAVSPALSYPTDSISEDGVPLPGRTTFREIVAPTYQLADGCGVHIYALGWAKDQDPAELHVLNEGRFKFGLKWAAESWHLPLWIDEVGVVLANDVAQMRAYIRMADIIMHHPINERVRMLCPFISAGSPGNPPAWPPAYLMRNPQCYAELGTWMSL